MRNEEFSAGQSEADAAAAADTAPWFSFDGLQTRIKRATFGRTKRNLSLFFQKFPVTDFFLFWDRKKMNPEKSGQ